MEKEPKITKLVIRIYHLRQDSAPRMWIRNTISPRERDVEDKDKRDNAPGIGKQGIGCTEGKILKGRYPEY